VENFLNAASHIVADHELGQVVAINQHTTTETGLTVRCELDPAFYPKGITVSDDEMAAIDIVRDEFHGEWNHTIYPSNHPDRAVDT
jgi:hypothetical protein